MYNEYEPEEPFIAARIAPEAAEILSWFPAGSLEVPLCHLDTQIADIFSNYKGHLILSMLCEGGRITNEVASHLANREGSLSISLSELDEDLATCFSRAKGDVTFTDVLEITEKTAEILKQKQGGWICLPWQNAFDSDGNPINNVPCTRENALKSFTEKEHEIYSFMQERYDYFDSLEEYDEEMEKKVHQETSSKYGVSTNEAAEIYEKISVVVLPIF